MKVDLTDKELSILSLALFIDVESDQEPQQEKLDLLAKLNSLIDLIN